MVSNTCRSAMSSTANDCCMYVRAGMIPVEKARRIGEVLRVNFPPPWSPVRREVVVFRLLITAATSQSPQ